MPDGKQFFDVPPTPYTLTADEICKSLGVDPSIGLTTSTVKDRHTVFGLNKLRTRNRANPLRILISQFVNPVVYLLVGAAIFSAWMDEYAEFFAIIIVLLINAAIGFVTELRAFRSMDALRRLSRHSVRVRRDKTAKTIEAEQLAPGDVVLVEAGDMVAADMRVVRASNLFSNESALTGESEPINITTDPVSEESIVAERTNMLFKGCAVSSGTGEAVVTNTGMSTELGRITELVDSSEATRSPLEDQLASLSRNMIGFTVLVTALVGISGVLAGQEWSLMVKSAVALAVATIPEGLPIVATLALARGMRRMAKHNALIEHLSAVETLGATTLIMTDKTGTLTENRMRVATLVTASNRYEFDTTLGKIRCGNKTFEDDVPTPLHDLLKTATLCNKASRRTDTAEAFGDPMEISLLDTAASVGMHRSELIAHYQESQEFAFDSNTRRMATSHHDNDGYLFAVKGAPESVFKIVNYVQSDTGIEPFDASRQQYWQAICDELARNGLRLLAFAGKTEEHGNTDPYKHLTLYGLVGFRDQPRNDVAQAIAETRRAGITVVMVTGDHAETASYIAREIGMVDGEVKATRGEQLGTVATADPTSQDEWLRQRVFSRVSPEQKLDLIALHQNAGEVVAMTGDGINDAPALKKADIGIAMGQRGTQVAKEAADMVLQDDAFSTIVHAIREGRVIFTNIRRFTIYLLSCNLSEILIVAIAVIAGLPLPLLPLQILFLNLVTDVFPAFALGTVEAGRDVLARSPRPPSEPILGRRQWQTIFIHGASITVATLVSLVCAIYILQLEGDALTTVSFYTLALAQLWHVFNMRNWRERWLHCTLVKNNYIWMAVVLCLSILVIAAWTPAISATLRLQPLDGKGWACIIGFSLIPVILREASAFFERNRNASGKTVKTPG